MKWPLNINNFTFFDRVKIAKFILNRKNRWTQDIEVKKFEKQFAEYVGSKYAVFVSSGSTANNLIAQYYKSISGRKKIVVLPSTTWQTSCAPWIKNGFTPHFIDINLQDFSLDRDKLIDFVKKNHKKIACIFPTSLIGYVPNLEFYRNLAFNYGVNVVFDNCENTLGLFNSKNVSSFFTSSTSTYFGHQIQSIEGGFIFTNSEEEYEYFLINRNHGMVRSVKPYGLQTKHLENKSVDPLFDFYSFGDNYRNTDLNAFIGQLDFQRVEKYTQSRKLLYSIFKNNLNLDKYYLPEDRRFCFDIPFCLPIIVKNGKEDLIKKVKDFCTKNKIEYRPIISGFLGYQTCYKKYFKSDVDYPNSVYLHKYGIYVGLYHGIKEESIKQLAKSLNEI